MRDTNSTTTPTPSDSLETSVAFLAGMGVLVLAVVVLVVVLCVCVVRSSRAKTQSREITITNQSYENVPFGSSTDGTAYATPSNVGSSSSSSSSSGGGAQSRPYITWSLPKLLARQRPLPTPQDARTPTDDYASMPSLDNETANKYVALGPESDDSKTIRYVDLPAEGAADGGASIDSNNSTGYVCVCVCMVCVCV